MLWKSTLFSGSCVFQNSYALSVEFVSLHNGSTWLLTNVCAPCTPFGKREFLSWFRNIQMPDLVDWLIVGDFNLYRNLEDRNKPGPDVQEMLLFNEAICKLGLIELPLKGERFTWSNKQLCPLLERLDWFFTSFGWTLNYPNCWGETMTMEVSDHTPCLISISTAIPRSKTFRFENFWMLHDDFLTKV